MRLVMVTHLPHETLRVGTRSAVLLIWGSSKIGAPLRVHLPAGLCWLRSCLYCPLQHSPDELALEDQVDDTDRDDHHDRACGE